VRVMVVRHAAPAPGKNIPVGKRVGVWVYELFIMRLCAEVFLVEDVALPSVGKNVAIRGVNWCGTCDLPSGKRCRASS